MKILLFALLFFLPGMPQQKTDSEKGSTITGTVYNAADNSPLPGVAIRVPGLIKIAGEIVDGKGKPIDSAKVWVKTDTVWTDRKGRFTLTVSSRGSEVQVWHPDYARRSFQPGPVLWFRITLSGSESPMRLLEEPAGN